MSSIELLRSWGYTVNERKISIDELYEAHANGTLKEAFGTGTAAVISPIGQFMWEGKEITVAYNRPAPSPRAPLKFAVTPSVVIEPPASTPAATAYPSTPTSISMPNTVKPPFTSP